MKDVPSTWTVANGLAVLRRCEPHLHRFAPWLLILFAAIYYGMYYRSSLNLGGEGGTVAVVAQSLMEGKRPIVDIFLGYNLMWFYPVVWLFQIFGPSYIALRIFFFVLCTITGLLAYRVVWRITAQPFYALLIAILLLYVPGMIFRNYMGLLGVLNILVLLEAYVLGHDRLRNRLLWIASSGLTLSLTFLIRVEIGFFLVPLYLALMALYPLAGAWAEMRRRFAVSISAVVMTGVLFLLTHLPFYLDAQKRGFAENFVGQYEQIPSMLQHHLSLYVVKSPPAPVKPAPESSTIMAEQTGMAREKNEPVTDPGTRPRPSLKDLQKPMRFPDKLLALDLHLPVILLFGIAVGGTLAFLISFLKSDLRLRGHALAVFAATGCSLAFFPQYYFFRPDLPHLTEFMCPFIVTLAICAHYACLGIARTRFLPWKIAGACFLVIALLDVTTYVYYADKKPSAGTSAARRFRTFEFKGENDVRVLLQREEAEEIQGIYDTIMAHSDAADYVVCYPYSPTVNFMTNRRSYLYNLYADNATSSKKFHAHTVAQIEEFKPAAILIDNRSINKIEVSRFSNWAEPTYQFIRQNYRLAGKFGTNEIYVRPDKLQSRP